MTNRAIIRLILQHSRWISKQIVVSRHDRCITESKNMRSVLGHLTKYNLSNNLCRRSVTYPPSGFREGYDLAAQAAGTLPSIILLKTCSNSYDMTTSPCTQGRKQTPRCHHLFSAADDTSQCSRSIRLILFFWKGTTGTWFYITFCVCFLLAISLKHLLKWTNFYEGLVRKVIPRHPLIQWRQLRFGANRITAPMWVWCC